VRRLTAIAGAFTAIAACASAGPPPGGPERHTPPEIVSISVDSGQTNVKVKSVVFQFDEVISDKPAGASVSLDQIFLISPRNGTPIASWHRTKVDVRPRKGFKPNTAYRITMLPGIVDLRNNVRKDTRTLVFSTGPDFPPYSVAGVVFDWVAQRPAVGAYIEATSHADTSLVYITASDSLGQFDAGPLGPGDYTVRALIDQNGNRMLDRNEKWDTTTVTITTTSKTVELDAIERDSTPPVIEAVGVPDSVTVRVTFDKAIDPRIPLQPALFVVQRADSSALEVRGVQWAAAFDRATQARVADSLKRVDSVKRANDTTRARPAPPPAAALPIPGVRPPPAAPKPQYPPPERAVILTLSPAAHLVPGARYVVTARGLRNLVGKSHDTRRVFDAPKPPPPPRDTTKRTPADSARRPPGATLPPKPPADSARRPPALVLR